MKKILVFAALAALLLLSLSGCSDDARPTLTYYVDGDVYHTDVLETEDETFSGIGKEPIKHGCLFGGWYYDEGVWEKPLSYVELNKAAENKEYKVYAKWETVKLEYVEADRSYTVVGLLLGWERLLLGLLIATIPAAIIMALLSRGKEGEEREFPFAPFLVIGFGISMLFGSGIIGWYLSLFGI